MKPTTWLLACLPLLLWGCSTVQPIAPVPIQPPPVALVTRCAVPDDLAVGSTAQALAEWVTGWIGAYGCERSKRTALIEAWPK